MSIAQPAKCIFCTFVRPARVATGARRGYHSTASRAARTPKFPSVKVEDVDLRAQSTPSRSELTEAFTPQQRAAIDAAAKLENEYRGENKVPWSINYYDNLTEIDPVVDHPVRAPWQNLDSNSRLKNDDELNEDLYQLMTSLPDIEDAAVQKWEDFVKNQRLTVGKEEAERHPRSALAPEVGSLEDPSSTGPRRTASAESTMEEAPTPALLQLMQTTGYTSRQIASLRVKTVINHRVVNQTRLGKISSMYFLSIAGNGNGLVGIGEGKSQEASEARLQSQYRAIRNMQPILRYENRTIFGDVNAKVGATELELYARPPGFGLRCQQYIWEICRCAGITDLAARVTRSRNPMNTVKAAIEALQKQKDPEDIARARGRKLVDVRKVYYADAI